MPGSELDALTLVIFLKSYINSVSGVIITTLLRVLLFSRARLLTEVFGQ